VTTALLYCAGGGIGDSLVASVVGRALRARFARVDALTLPGHRATLERVPDLDEVLVDDGGDEAALAAALCARGYGACVVTWATARTARVPQLAKIPVRVGQARRLYSRRFTQRVTVRSEEGDTQSHWTDIQLDYARALDCDTDDHRYRFVPTEGDAEEAERLRVILSLSKDDDDFIIVNPCNAIASKRGNWPVEGWAALCAALAQKYGMPVLVSGSPADAPVAGAIVTAALRRRAGCASADGAHGWAGVGQAQDDTGVSGGGGIGGGGRSSGVGWGGTFDCLRVLHSIMIV